MFFGTIFLLIMFLILKYVLAWIVYVNKIDSRLGDSTWRWSYDYQVIGERDFSDLDDKEFVRLRRKKNKNNLLTYPIIFWNYKVNTFDLIDSRFFVIHINCHFSLS